MKLLQPQFPAALLFLVLFLALVITTQVLYSRFKVRVDSSRKFLHVAGGILALFIPSFISSHWWVLILCLLSFLLLLVTYLKRVLPSVHETKRMSIGSVLFPIPIYICFYIAGSLQDELLFYLPISILTISDTIAEWSGKKWGHRTVQFFKGQKTLAGSLGFAISCIVICGVWLELRYELPVQNLIMISLVITLVSTVAELISLKGWDNLTVPLAALLVLYLLKI
jgi:phytol kinase